MRRWPATRWLLSVLLITGPTAHALRAGFSVSTTRVVIPLEDFATRGGFINVTLSLMPSLCTQTQNEAAAVARHNTTSCWDMLDSVFMGVFTYDQWRAIGGADAWDADRCLPRAVSWTSLSVAVWQESPVDASGAAVLSLRGETTLPLRDASSRDRLPSPAVPLAFDVRYALPASHDLFTLSLFNCQVSPPRPPCTRAVVQSAVDRTSL